MTAYDRTARPGYGHPDPVWDELYEWRLARGLSLRQMAPLIGRHARNLSMAETGRQDPGLRVVRTVLDVLDLTLLVVPKGQDGQ